MDIVPHYEFWLDGIRTAALNARLLLQLAGQPVSLANIARIMESAPHRRSDVHDEHWRECSFCSQCLKAAHQAQPRDNRIDGIASYFLDYFPQRTVVAKYMLIDAFVGIRQAMEG
jgi:hypothetical protein